MANVARDYFMSLFTSLGVDDCDSVLEGVSCCITDEMNHNLTRDFSVSEFWDAVKSMNSLKAAGEDGFQWVEVEGDSRAVVTKLLSASSDTSEISVLIGEAKGLAKNFRDCKLVFRNRGGNTVAHSLAHLRGELTTDTIWVEEAPWQIELLAAEDRRWLDPP
ncbi:hypothetical protein V6N12_048834 [Hibiscus sabdariffa]|uniref:RNase H type-1 domain-containing protein n=1 Tax=Hibiscus sabdariffa TaxID=183260 RepID=A0ABR2EIE6_9ROSI